MRIWDIEPRFLCRNHLLGEHRELHALWTVITQNKTGYAHHPETLRWKGKLKALFIRHSELAEEMKKRGYVHRSPLDANRATGAQVQTAYIDDPLKQRAILKAKGCACFATIRHVPRDPDRKRPLQGQA